MGWIEDKRREAVSYLDDLPLLPQDELEVTREIQYFRVDRDSPFQPGSALSPGQWYAKLLLVHKLTGIQNNGQHVLFVDVLDDRGQRLIGHTVKFFRYHLDIHGEPRIDDIGLVLLDKPENEPGTNIPMWGESLYAMSFNHVGQGLETGMPDGTDIPSDVAANFVEAFPDDDPPGSTWGHHSWYLVFVLTRWQGQEPDPIGTEIELSSGEGALVLSRSRLEQILIEQPGDQVVIYLEEMAHV